MPSVVNDKCTKQGACAEVCPVSAFKVDEDMFVVDPDICIDCGVCISECPEGAITNDSDADDKWVAHNKEKALTCHAAK